MSDKVIELVTTEEKTKIDKSNLLAEKTLDYFFSLVKEKDEVIVNAIQWIHINLIQILKDEYVKESHKDRFIEEYLESIHNFFKMKEKEETTPKTNS